MLDNDNQLTPLLKKHRITRREMLLTTGGALAVILLAGCGGGGRQPSGPVSGEFIGRDVNSLNVSERVADRTAPAPLFAIIAEEAENGEERDVRAYMCDGSSVTEWFRGPVAGNTIDLTSESGEAQLQAELTQDGASGTFTLSGGEPIEFSANRATRVAGLYDVVITPTGAISGTSWGGNELRAQLVEQPATDASNRTTAAVGTVTLPDGTSIDYSESHEGASQTAEGTWEPSGEYRYILLPTGGGHGAKKNARTGSSLGIIGLDKKC